mmetsp:Transcript_17402/g.49812  ORF Transcript_17402/g.49812 Transcript_17402/m.49812 type:complete len:199 (-) Transcript_17402:69-665(-)
MSRRSLSTVAGAVAVATCLSSSAAFMASPQTSSALASTLQSRPDAVHGGFLARTMRRSQTIMVATSATTLMTDTSTGLAEIDDTNFRDLFGDEKAVLIDVCAPWCGPCKLIKPVVERAADKWAKAVNVVKYDVENENVSKLKVKLDEMGVEISALPTLILLKDGRHISSRSGVVTDMDVNTFLSRNLHKARTAGGDEQ